jgi:hypothetical protein
LNWKTIQEKKRLESGMTADGKEEAKKDKWRLVAEISWST